MPENNLAQLGYEHYYLMLSDKIRMDAYQKAIFKMVKPGDIVVDLGSGTGILSIWAVKAGAKKVYSIEKTDAIHLAKEIARRNKCLDKIQFFNENSIDIDLPEKADVLISETLGSFAIDENTLEFTLDARKRFLKPNAVMIPESIEIFITPVDDAEVYHKIDFWRKIPEIDFTPAFELFSKKIMVEQVKEKSALAAISQIASFDLHTFESSEFYAGLYIQIQKSGFIHGIAGWFNTKLCDGIQINTSPQHPVTHWKQAFFPFKEPIEVIAGDVLDWKVRVGSKLKNSDDTLISYEYRCTQLMNEAKQHRLQSNQTGQATKQATKPARRVGRNDLCPCGSGKKYKKCCAL